jgi:hypothetical protein
MILAVEMIPSFASNTAARSHPIRPIRCVSLCIRLMDQLSPTYRWRDGDVESLRSFQVDHRIGAPANFDPKIAGFVHPSRQRQPIRKGSLTFC